MSWVVRVSEHRHEDALAYDSPPHENAADARALAAIILGRPQLTGAGPWREAIPGGQRTVSVQHTENGRLSKASGSRARGRAICVLRLVVPSRARSS